MFYSDVPYVYYDPGSSHLYVSTGNDVRVLIFDATAMTTTRSYSISPVMSKIPRVRYFHPLHLKWPWFLAFGRLRCCGDGSMSRMLHEICR